MPALLFLAIAWLLGDRIRRWLLPPTVRLYEDIGGSPAPAGLPAWTFELPAALVLGILPLTWAVYLAACGFAALLPLSLPPLLPANLLVLSLASVAIAWPAYRDARRKGLRLRIPRALPPLRRTAVDLYRRFRLWTLQDRSWLFLFSTAVFLQIGWYVMGSVFFAKDGMLVAGGSVFSDFAPHTALIRSFSHGRNFPTEYPHFAGDGIRYHFLFLFLTGNLESLGLRIDHAFNLLGVLGLVSFCLLLGTLAVLLVRRRAAFWLAPLLLFFRSSLAFLTFLTRIWEESDGNLGGVLVGILVNRRFIGDTPYENWGLWAVNVYGNQRHLLWGFAVLLLVLFLMLPLWARARRPFLLSRHAWIPGDLRPVLVAAALLAMLPYFHGSVLIAAYLVLGVLALFSSGRLAFVLALVPSGLSALLQARLFSGGAAEVATPAFVLGFVSPDKSPGGILHYAIYAFGIAFLLLPGIPFLHPRRHAVLWLAFLAPFVFAFTVSLTPDVVVNHKFILLTFGLENIFYAGILCRLFRPLPEEKRAWPPASSDEAASPSPAPFQGRRFAARLARLYSVSLAVVLAVALTATGVIDFWTYFTINRVTARIDLASPLTAWIERTTSPQAVFLTPNYHYHAFFFSGRKAFLGWPYFAWSAGHDTYGRSRQVKWLYEGAEGNPDAFRAFCRENGIGFAIIDDIVRGSADYAVQESFFDRYFPVCAAFPGLGNMKVYDILGATTSSLLD